MGYRVLGVSNAKVRKGEKRGYLSGIVHMLPYDLSGHNVCAMASPGCISGCLNTAGRGQFTATQEARKKKTLWFFNDRVSFFQALIKDIRALERKAKREGKGAVVRLNGTSDILWERLYITGDMIPGEKGSEMLYQNIMEMFPDVIFYDYTKHRPAKRTNLPKNYTLTFSLDERPESDVRAGEAMAMGWNVAAVFRSVPDRYLGRPVVNGDQDDLRFLDPAGVIVGLTPKGKAKQDTSGFVR